MVSENFWRTRIKKGWKKNSLVLVFFFVFLSVFILVRPAQASVSEAIWSILGYLAEAVTWLELKIMLWLVHFLIQLSGYNNFINASVVQTGWKLMRDVANMFYILLMLVIAFGTILKIERYSWKTMLPRLIFTAILVNFSKTIIGLMIDFGQVVMLTFVNGYAAAAGGNFVTLFGTAQMVNQTAAAGGEMTNLVFSAATGLMLNAILMAIALIVVLVFVAILLFRIVTLWILIVFSPLVFVLGIFEKGKKYYAQWWDKLINQIIVGPIVAFFLWLSLATMGNGGNIREITGNNNALDPKIVSDTTEEGVGGNITDTAAGVTDISKWENLGSFAVAIAMLLTGLSMISELGAAGAGLANKAKSFVETQGTLAAKKLAIPAGLTAATGGIGWGLLARGGIKGTMDVMARMPVIGKPIQALRKEAAPYGLGESGRIVKGIHKKVTLPIGKRLPLVGTGATKMEAELLAEKRKEAREGAARVSELAPQDAVREAKRKPFTSKGKQWTFAAQARVLGDPVLRGMMSQEELKEIVSGFKGLGDETGNSDKANSVLKDFYKENLHLKTATPAVAATATAPAVPAKSREENIEEELRNFSKNDALKISAAALADKAVVERLPVNLRDAILKDGSQKQQQVLSRTILTAKTALTAEEIKGPAEIAGNAGKVETEIRAHLGELPGGIFDQLIDVFKALPGDLQASVFGAGKLSQEAVTSRHLSNDAAGENLAGAIAGSGKDEAIQKIQLNVGADFERALNNFVNRATAAGRVIDPKIYNTLAAMKKDSGDILREARKGRGLSENIKAPNAPAWLKKLKPRDIVDTATNTVTPEGKEIYQNIPIPALAKLIAEARKPEAPADLKEMTGYLAALVEKARTAPPAAGGRPLTGNEASQLNKLLFATSTSEAVDWSSKTGVNLV